MKPRRTLLLATLACGAAWAQAGGEFEIPDHTIDGGGGRATGGAFVLDGTIGQHDAGVAPMAGGPFSLAGGFWPGLGVAPLDEVLTDGFEDPLPL